MSITALEIQQIKFGEVRKGYNPDEVDEFLEKVATDVDVLNRAITEAAARIKNAEERAKRAEDDLAQAQAELKAQAKSPVSALADTGSLGRQKSRYDMSASEEAISKAFIAAQVSADRLKEEARQEAEKLFREADAKAKDIVRDSHDEKLRVQNEIERLRLSSEKFRTDFLSMLKHYSTDAQNRFPAFQELVPESGLAEEDEEPETASLFHANDASSSAYPAPAKEDRPSSSDPGATIAMPKGSSPLIDDELEIEEID
ncbi:MAG: DivIVA domain-containing protein [Coriobacteriia bacterium]|nr:DivIVA domain-containing protein [Coriobacteriia bacterium]